MIFAFKLTKRLTFALTTLALASVTFAGRVAAQSSTATPLPINAEVQAAAQTSSGPTNVVPVDMMRSSGKWINNLSFNDIASETASAKKTALPSQLYFKPATPGWIHVLDAASYAMTLTVPLSFDILPSPNRPPPPNIQYPLK